MSGGRYCHTCHIYIIYKKGEGWEKFCFSLCDITRFFMRFEREECSIARYIDIVIIIKCLPDKSADSTFKLIMLTTDV